MSYDERKRVARQKLSELRYAEAMCDTAQAIIRADNECVGCAGPLLLCPCFCASCNLEFSKHDPVPRAHERVGIECEVHAQACLRSLRLEGAME